MIICMPTQGSTGKNDTLFDHFGSAPYFTLYDDVSEEITVVENRNRHHGQGACHPMRQLDSHGVKCVVCTGMGRRAIEMLRAEGVTLCKAHSPKVFDVIADLKRGESPEMTLAHACAGHGQRGTGPGQGTAARRGHDPQSVPTINRGLRRGKGFLRGGRRDEQRKT